MDKFDLKKIFKFSLKKSVPLSKKTRNAKRDWMLLLSIMVVLLIGVAVYNIYLFSQVQSGALFTTKVDEIKVRTIVNEELLNETLEVFRERKDNFDKYKRTFPDIPSVN